MKKLTALLLTLVMALGLAACGSTETAAEPAAEGDDVTLDIIAAQYGQNTAQWWADFEVEFEEANPGIDLNVEVVSWNDIYTKVSTLIQNDQAPDILNIDSFADYYADDLLLPAEDYVSADTYAKFYEAFLDQSDVDGTVWAIPDLASARALYYNADLLEEAGVEVPTTWDELTAACEALNEYYGDDVYPWGVDMTTDEGQAAFAYYTWNNGGGFVDANDEWTLNCPENVEAIQYVIDLYNNGLTNTDPANQTRYDLQDLFGQGKLAMMIGPNSIPGYIAANGDSINYGVASIPSNTDASVSAGVMDRFMCFDNGYSEAELAAISTFFDFFYDDARYSAWVSMEDFLPATVSGGEILAAADENMAAWVDIVGSAKFYPTSKTEWIDVKQGVINVEQQALLGGDIQALLDDLQAQIAG